MRRELGITGKKLDLKPYHMNSSPLTRDTERHLRADWLLEQDSKFLRNNSGPFDSHRFESS
jgi:hypothetical protein